MEKSVVITNGTGTVILPNDTYNVTANVNGYNNSSIDPSTITVDSTTNTYNFSISATGTLTIHVTEDGTSTGTPVIGASFIRTDSAGTEYGSAITTDTNGDAVFNNVPFSGTNPPIIYYKQTASDGEHTFDNTVKSTTLSTDTLTVEVENTPIPPVTINLTDSNYGNLPIETGTLTFNGN